MTTYEEFEDTTDTPTTMEDSTEVSVGSKERFRILLERVYGTFIYSQEQRDALWLKAWKDGHDILWLKIPQKYHSSVSESTRYAAVEEVYKQLSELVRKFA